MTELLCKSHKSFSGAKLTSNCLMHAGAVFRVDQNNLGAKLFSYTSVWSFGSQLGVLGREPIFYYGTYTFLTLRHHQVRFYLGRQWDVR